MTIRQPCYHFTGCIGVDEGVDVLAVAGTVVVAVIAGAV